MVYTYTTYFIGANTSNKLIVKDNLIIKDNLVVRNDVADNSPTNDIIIGVTVLDKDFKVKRLPNCYIIHYIYVLPNLHCKGYRTYLMRI